MWVDNSIIVLWGHPQPRRSLKTNAQVMIINVSMWGDNSTYHSTRPPSATTPGLSLSRPDSASFQVQTCFLTSKYFLGMQSIKHKFKLWKMTILNSCRHEHTELRGWHPGTQIELSCIFKSTTYKTRRDFSQVESTKGSRLVRKVQFFLTLFKRGGVKPMFKIYVVNLVCSGGHLTTWNLHEKGLLRHWWWNLRVK